MMDFHLAMNAVHDHVDDLPERLARLDLNLLVVFDALMRERGVTRAAARVGLSQSAMSHALRRLRMLLDDPLLVRGQRGMLPTPRALALEVPLRRSLDGLGRALDGPMRFDPKTARRTFRLAAPDAFDLFALPRLLQALSATAPGLDVVVGALPSHGLQSVLETGELDAAIVVNTTGRTRPEDEREGLVQRVLLRDQFVCLLRDGHPALDKTLTMARYAKLSHVVVSPAGRGSSAIDLALAKHKLSRRIRARVPAFGTALSIAAQTDLAVSAPSAIAAGLPPSLPLRARPLPLKLARHAVRLVWHTRFSADPGHRFLREQLLAVGRSFGSG